MKLISVSALNAAIKEILGELLPDVWVVGEVSDLSRPHSGHLYFTLKDRDSQIRAVIWRSTAAGLPFALEDGMEVVCQGAVDVYPPRGSYQLIVRRVEPRGVGALQRALQRLQQKLAAEGLFDPARKRPLPRMPRHIAFVTSPTGAAIRDFLEVLRRRWRGVTVTVIPARVQGEGAAAEIARGIELANQLAPPPDVLVVGRGGGSVEDLWCFNEEQVVRAIYRSAIPVVSAVGHEIDVTLADLVADVRALTPSEAAERVVPAADEVAAGLRQLQQRLAVALRRRADLARSAWQTILRRRALRRPLDTIHDHQRRVDELETRAARAIEVRRRRSSERLATLAAHLESLSPLAVLGRGYSVTTAASGAPLTDATAVAAGDTIRTRLACGGLVSVIAATDTGSPASGDAPQEQPQ